MPKASTRARLLAAARELVAAGGGAPPSAGAVARRAGVSRLTVYHHFGSHGALLTALAAEASAPSVPDDLAAPPLERLRRLILAACERWASNPGLYRGLPAAAEALPRERLHSLAVALGEADRLRPGCSLREAEDVIGLAASFPSFDCLHRDGRRSPAMVAEILMRLAATVLSNPPA